MKLSCAILALSLGAASARPWNVLHHKRADSCEQYATVSAGQFTLYNNLWGQENGNGEGCVGVDSASSPIAWHATWTWTGGDGQVKSYPNLMPANFTPTQVSGLSSISTTWDWR